MAGLIRRVLDALLKTTDGVSEIEISAVGPVFKIEKAQIAEMLRHPQSVRLMLSECFIWRHVFWEDKSGEHVDPVLTSLETVERELKEHERTLSKSSDLDAIGTAKFVLSWINSVREVRRNLYDRIAEINKDKAEDPFMDDAGEQRRQAMVEALCDLRLQVYPTVRTLIAILPEGDDVRVKAERRLDEGLATLGPEQARRTEPDIAEAT